MESKTKTNLLRAVRVIVGFAYFVLLAYVVILSIAFVLQLLGANPTADFAEWIYRSADRIMEPFRGLFPPKEFDGNSVFDGSMLFAILIYSMIGALLGYGVDRLTDRLHRADRPAQPQQAWPPPPPSTGYDGTAGTGAPTASGQWAPGTAPAEWPQGTVPTEWPHGTSGTPGSPSTPNV